MADDALTPPPGFTLDSVDKPPPGFTLDAAKPNVEPSSAIERVGTGLGDIVWGAGQLASHIVPGVQSDIVDQMAKDRETEYEAKRKAAGSTGVDWARMAGNVANPINYVGGAAIAAPTLAGKVALGAGIGATAGALQPATGQGSYWGQKAIQTAAGAATGGALPVAGAAASRVISPQTTDAVKNLTEKGINPTLGQIVGSGDGWLGKTYKGLEDKLTSIPGVGDIINYGRRGAVQDMNRSLYNMALEPIGEKSTAKVGREAVAEVRDKLSARYDQLLEGHSIPIDDAFRADVAHIADRTANLASPQASDQFRNIVRYTLLQPAADANGVIDARAMKTLDSQLGFLSDKFGKSQDPNHQMIGDALDNVQEALRGAMERGNPDIAAGLAKANAGWTAYARIRNAASKTGSKEGIVSPSTLLSSVRALDNSVGKTGTATGTGYMQKFADDMNKVLGGSYPDSGTIGRGVAAALLGGGAYLIHPGAVAVSAGIALPSLMRKPIAAAMTKRPAIAPAIAEGAETAAQYLAPGMGQVAGRIQGQ
jgi:hypothetical protein